MKLLYKPFAIIAGVIASKLGQNIFKTLWARVEDRQPPKPTTEEATLPLVVGAAALEAATTAAVRAAVDRATARTFHYFTGYWPGDHRPELEEST